MNLVVPQTQLLWNVPIYARHSEARSLDRLMKLLVSIFVFDRNHEALTCKRPLVWPERENPQMSLLSWLIQRLVRRERQLAFRTQVKSEFNVLTVGTSLRLRRYSPLIGLDLFREIKAVDGVSRVVGG